MSGIRDVLRGVAALAYRVFSIFITWRMHPAAPHHRQIAITRAKLEGPRVRY